MKTINSSNSLVEKRPDILYLWDYEKNAGISPQDISIHHKKILWWKCECGHSWQAPVNGVASNGTRCPYCAGLRACPGETDFMTLFPEIAAEWDYEKNGNLSPCNVAPLHIQRSGGNVPLVIVTNLRLIPERGITSPDAPAVQDERCCPDLMIWKR